MDESGPVSSSEKEALLNRLMRRQAALSIRVACGFILLLIAIPLANLCAPEIAASKVLGFTLTWLVLGVLFYPLTWLLSGYFVKQSDRIEESLLKEESRPNTQYPTPNTDTPNPEEGGKE